jgi:hypothetical protein
MRRNRKNEYKNENERDMIGRSWVGSLLLVIWTDVSRSNCQAQVLKNRSINCNIYLSNILLYLNTIYMTLYWAFWPTYTWVERDDES